MRPTDPDAKHPPAGDADLDEATLLLRAKLNLETARIPWAELQRFFARGVAVWIAPGLDLVDTAVAFSQDRPPWSRRRWPPGASPWSMPARPWSGRRETRTSGPWS